MRHLFRIVGYFLTQGSIVTCFRCGRIFNDSFITRLLLSPIVKEF